MTVLLTQRFNGFRHLLPVVLASKQLLGGGGTLIQTDAAVQHRGVHHIFPYLVRWQVQSGLLSAVEEGDGFLVYFVVAANPALQVSKVTVRVQGLNLGLIVTGKTLNGNKGVGTGSTTTATHHIDATATGHSLVVRGTHDATVQ